MFTHQNNSDNMHVENVLTSWALTIGSTLLSIKGVYMIISSILTTFLFTQFDYGTIGQITEFIVKAMQFGLMIGSGSVTYMTYKKLKAERDNNQNDKK